MTRQKTKEPVIHHSKAFMEGLGILSEEIELALQWNRPSILLAIHNSKTGRDEAQQSLEKEIAKSGKQVAHIHAESATPDLILSMSQTSGFKDMVFFVSGIENADRVSEGKVYRALNIRRELLIEKCIRVVFWLNESEAANLPRLAPDFWAFRHRAVEFAPKRSTRDQSIPMGLFLWEEDFPWMEADAQKDKLAYYEDLLARLPVEENSISSRIETLLRLVHHGWLLHDLKKFSEYSNSGFDLLKKYPISQYQASLLNARGIATYEEGNKQEAGAHFAQALSHDPDNSAIKMNTGITLHGLGKNKEAIQVGKQAINQDPANPHLWKILGYLFLSMGKLEDAINSMTKAQELSPYNVECCYALAVCYYKNEQPAECANELSKAEKISPPQNALQHACINVLSGKTDEALTLLKRSLETKTVDKYHILHDPNLHFLLNSQELMVFGQQ